MGNEQEGIAAAVASELEKISKVLTTAGRKHVASKNFALPGGRYPIHDAAHARNALARIAQHGTPEEKARVRAAVARKYPGIKEKQAEEKKSMGAEDFAGVSGAALGGGAAQHILPDVGKSGMTKFRRGAMVAAMIGMGNVGSKDLLRAAREVGKEKKAFLQGDPKAMQVAQQRMVEIWVRLMILYMLYWDGHWKSAGPMQNSDHALFARLYGDTVKPIDEISEKIHGYFGNQGFSMPQAMGMVIQGLQELYSSGEDHVRMGLLAEDYFQAHLRQTHRELTQLGVLPLGLDDWLMATASEFETHGYLLQQRAAMTKTASAANLVLRRAIRSK